MKDDFFRYRVNIRLFNDEEICDWYKFPKMDEPVGSLDDAFIFSLLGTNSDYGQVEIVAGEGENTTFKSNHALFHFIKTVCALKNAPETSIRWRPLKCRR